MNYISIKLILKGGGLSCGFINPFHFSNPFFFNFKRTHEKNLLFA